MKIIKHDKNYIYSNKGNNNNDNDNNNSENNLKNPHFGSTERANIHKLSVYLRHPPLTLLATTWHFEATSHTEG